MSAKHAHIREVLERTRGRYEEAVRDDGACQCGESDHLNAIHDLANVNVPYLLAIAEGLLAYADKETRIITAHPNSEVLRLDQLAALRDIFNQAHEQHTSIVL